MPSFIKKSIGRPLISQKKPWKLLLSFNRVGMFDIWPHSLLQNGSEVSYKLFQSCNIPLVSRLNIFESKAFGLGLLKCVGCWNSLSSSFTFTHKMENWKQGSVEKKAWSQPTTGRDQFHFSSQQTHLLPSHPSVPSAMQAVKGLRDWWRHSYAGSTYRLSKLFQTVQEILDRLPLREKERERENIPQHCPFVCCF